MLFYKDVCIKFVNGFVVVVFFVFFVLDIYFIKSIVRENIEELVRSMFLWCYYIFFLFNDNLNVCKFLKLCKNNIFGSF